jgi:predicted nucleic acid-binding protein
VKVYLDASFLINAKRSDLHKYFKPVFEEIIITDSIEREVVEKGIEFHKKDAILTKDEIDRKEITVKKVDPETIKPIEKVLHEGEASIIALIETINKREQHLIGSDDRVFNRYIKYIYFDLGKASLGVFSSLNFVVYLKEMKIIDLETARMILQSFEKIKSHNSDAILEAYHDLENEGEE